jgi:hypothetical protein
MELDAILENKNRKPGSKPYPLYENEPVAIKFKILNINNFNGFVG